MNRCLVCNKELDEDELAMELDVCMECDLDCQGDLGDLEYDEEEWLAYARDLMFDDDGLGELDD